MQITVGAFYLLVNNLVLADTATDTKIGNLQITSAALLGNYTTLRTDLDALSSRIDSLLNPIQVGG